MWLPDAPFDPVIWLCAFSSAKKPPKVAVITNDTDLHTTVTPEWNDWPVAGQNVSSTILSSPASPPGNNFASLLRMVPKQGHAAVRCNSHWGQSANAQ